jgi:hypothetical protein
VKPAFRAALVACGTVAAAVVPAGLVAFPARRDLAAARSAAAAVPAPALDADAVFAAEAEHARLAKDVLPIARAAATALAEAAPAFDADGDRALYVVRAAEAAGVTLLAPPRPLPEKPEDADGGYAFPAADCEAEGGFAGLLAFLTALERGARLVVVERAHLRRTDVDRPTLRLLVRLRFAVRTDAPDPARAAAVATPAEEGPR